MGPIRKYNTTNTKNPHGNMVPDSNGQLGRGAETKNTRIIGPYTYNQETEKGNGQRL